MHTPQQGKENGTNGKRATQRWHRPAHVFLSTTQACTPRHSSSTLLQCISQLKPEQDSPGTSEGVLQVHRLCLRNAQGVKICRRQLGSWHQHCRLQHICKSGQEL